MATTTVTAPLVFHNGYITNIDSNHGWNQTPSKLSLSLVDIPDQDFDQSPPLAIRDITNPSTTGYIPPEVGSFQTFNLSGIMTAQGANPSGISCPYDFQGIVISHNIPKKTSSANIKQITINDTREVINNIPVIISNMARDVKLPQACNAFSWWDVWWPGVGKLNISDSNDYGIGWEKIRDAFNGKPLSVRDLNAARLPSFSEVVPNFDADGYYFEFTIPGAVQNNHHDGPSTINYRTAVRDSITNNPARRNKSLPPYDWTVGKAIPSGFDQGSLQYGQSTNSVHRIEIRNVARGSGAIIHCDTGYEVNLTTSTASGIINPIIFDFYNERYIINLDNIPVQDANFRIKGDIIYLGDLIDKVSSFGQFDWFVDKTTTNSNGVHEIKISTVDRRKKLAFDEQAINSWLDTFNDTGGPRVIRYDQGRELRNDPTMMVLFGAKREQLTQKAVSGQWYGVQKGGRTTMDTISRYAGELSTIRTVCSIDFKHLNLPFLQPTYNFDELTLRAALVDPIPFGSLFNYLCHIYHPIIVDLEILLGISKPGAGLDFTKGQKPFLYQYRTSHMDYKSYRYLINGLTNAGNMGIIIMEIIGNTIARFAQEYWGKQFVVRFPTSMLLNWELTQSAFQGLTYNDATAFFRDLYGVKVHGFVLFKNIDPFFIETDVGEKELVLVKDKNIGINFTNAIDYINYQTSNLFDLYVAADFEIVDNHWCVAKISSPIKWVNPNLYNQQLTRFQQQTRAIAYDSDTQIGLLGTDWGGLESQCMYPQYAYIPLVAKNDRYGPWISEGLELDQASINGVDQNGTPLTRIASKYRIKTGYDGRLEILSDEDLSPWVMGGTPTDIHLGMNNGANAKVANASSNLIKPINADITIEGLPTIRLGEEITNGTNRTGANISDISIQVNEQQITTRYVVKNFAAKQREYHNEDYRMGSVMAIHTGNIQGNIPTMVSGQQRLKPTINKHENKQSILKRSGIKNEAEAMLKTMVVGGQNYSIATSTNASSIAKADDTTNHQQIAYANNGALIAAASLGAAPTTSVAGLTATAITQITAALK